ncbi:hypothetical protein Dimus_004679 [Dionaea muscipula]
MNEDQRTYFTCPFCYIDIELSALCNHLEEEHCFDVKNAVCPVCALNLGKDVIEHFKVHHANSIKSRRKSSHKYSSFWSSNSMRELSSVYGFAPRSSCGTARAQDSSPDPLLSPFLCTTPYPAEPKTAAAAKYTTSTSTDPSVTLEPKSSTPLTASQGREKDTEERRQKAEFCKHLIVSTIF